MRRGEGVAFLASGLALVTAGVTWLFGPWGLIGAGAVLVVAALLVVDVKE